MEDYEQARTRKMTAEADLLELELAQRSGKPRSLAAGAVAEPLCGARLVETIILHRSIIGAALLELNSAIEGAEAAGLQVSVDLSQDGKVQAKILAAAVR